MPSEGGNIAANTTAEPITNPELHRGSFRPIVNSSHTSSVARQMRIAPENQCERDVGHNSETGVHVRSECDGHHRYCGEPAVHGTASRLRSGANVAPKRRDGTAAPLYPAPDSLVNSRARLGRATCSSGRSSSGAGCGDVAISTVYASTAYNVLSRRVCATE